MLRKRCERLLVPYLGLLVPYALAGGRVVAAAVEVVHVVLRCPAPRVVRVSELLMYEALSY